MMNCQRQFVHANNAIPSQEQPDFVCRVCYGRLSLQCGGPTPTLFFRCQSCGHICPALRHVVLRHQEPQMTMGVPQMTMGMPQMIMGVPQMIMGVPQMAPQMIMGAPQMAPQRATRAPRREKKAPQAVTTVSQMPTVSRPMKRPTIKPLPTPKGQKVVPSSVVLERVNLREAYKKESEDAGKHMRERNYPMVIECLRKAKHHRELAHISYADESDAGHEYPIYATGALADKIEKHLSEFGGDVEYRGDIEPFMKLIMKLD